MASTAHSVSIDWHWLMARAALAIAVGLASLLFPANALYPFTLMLGGYALADGLAAFASGRRTSGGGALRPYLFRTIAAGVAFLLFIVAPRLTFVSETFLTLAIASSWAALGGLLEIVAVLKRDAEAKGYWLLVAAGLVSIVWALAMPVTLFFRPGETIVAISGVIGLFLCAIGAVLAAQAIQLRPITNKRP